MYNLECGTPQHKPSRLSILLICQSPYQPSFIFLQEMIIFKNKPMRYIDHNITLFRFITILCGSDNFPWNILHIRSEVGIFYRMLSLPHKNVMNLNNVMKPPSCKLIYNNTNDASTYKRQCYILMNPI